MKARQPEFELACAIADLIRKTLEPGVFWSAIENGERRPVVAVERCKRKGVRNGLPDLFFIREGRFYGLELKAAADATRRQRKGVVSDDQRAVALAIGAAEGQYCVAFGWDEAVARLEDWKIIRPDRSLVRASAQEAA